jgi:hypothetical protein
MMEEMVKVCWNDAKEVKPHNQKSVWVTVAPKSQKHGGSVIRAFWDGRFWRSLSYNNEELEFYTIPSRMYPGMEVKAWASKIPPYREVDEGTSEE